MFYPNAAYARASPAQQQGFDPNQIGYYPTFNSTPVAGIPIKSLRTGQTDPVRYEVSTNGQPFRLQNPGASLTATPDSFTATGDVTLASTMPVGQFGRLKGDFPNGACEFGHLDVVAYSPRTLKIAVVFVRMRDTGGNFLPTPMHTALSPITKQAVEQNLNRIYGPAGVNWHATMLTEQINCDLDGDGVFNWEGGE